jgi:hypothetical protein
MFFFVSAYQLPDRRQIDRRKREYFLRLYDSPRFPRQVFDEFRARVTANGGAWVDELRRLLECHEDERPRKTE